jgi:integrase
VSSVCVKVTHLRTRTARRNGALLPSVPMLPATTSIRTPAGPSKQGSLTRASIQRYMSVLPAVFKLAVRDGAIPMSPFDLIEREKDDAPRQLFEWSRESISKLIAASETVARKPDARYDYSNLIRVLVLTGLRVSEVLALRKQDIDLLGGRLFVRHSLGRDGSLGLPKTAAGVRVVPLSEELVNLFAGVIPADAAEEHFVFHAKSNPSRPLSYWNFRSPGFEPALKEAKLDGKGITVHQLRHAAVSMFAWRASPLSRWRP